MAASSVSVVMSSLLLRRYKRPELPPSVLRAPPVSTSSALPDSPVSASGVVSPPVGEARSAFSPTATRLLSSPRRDFPRRPVAASCRCVCGSCNQACGKGRCCENCSCDEDPLLGVVPSA